ncbi:MAG: ABC transporter substrate-binding protein [Methanothrix sp.]|nr:ABC transporter substrate-binding protein [Methanothrix sp.]
MPECLGPERLGRIARIFFIILIFFNFHSCSVKNRLQGYVYYRLNSDPTTLDPALIVDVTGGYISAKIFNGLVKLDENLNVIPDIAESWEVSGRGTEYIFHLKKNVKFTNNREVTVDDFKYSFKRILSPTGKAPNSWVLEKISGAREFMQGRAPDISGIEIQDRYTLKIRLDQPFSPFLHLLTMTAAYVLPKEEVERLGADFSSHPIGTGPFLLKEWRNNNEIILTRNNHYFSEHAKISGIVYRIIPEDLTAVTEFELGNLDVITVPASEYARYSASPQWKEYLSSAHGLNIYYLGFNCSRSPFDNINLRKAVAYAIDREKILQTFYENRGRLAQGPIPDMLRKWQMLFPYTYNPQEAKRIIDAEGIKDRTIVFYITAEQEAIDMAEIIQSYLNKVGLKVRIKQLEWSAYKSAVNKGEADMFWLSWWADYPDPENFLFPLFHSSNHGAGGNRSRYSNKEVDRLIEAGQKSLDISKRDGYYSLAEKIIDEEVPWVFFWHKTDFTLRQPYLKNYKIYPIYSIDKGVEVSF